ncbi:hypothetical protein CPB83DRAFT_838413 [Crepidotus variabilis]|uniref:Uncharacterized protein n=1 Tax=Crepidotus variabilis TaxID=179855 RepID=A0A9P6JL75_9AGAR|nr:hypothetical protein CPB83DRAFT_838413 [Crepidotus variabilis]
MLELQVDFRVVENLSLFASAVDYAMAVEGRSELDLWNLREEIVRFLVGFERLYIGTKPELNSRARLCIFQLIHIPMHIKWHGSIRGGSQATVERSIGEMGRKIKSKKSPFANLTNIIIRRERTKILSLYYPNLFPSPRSARSDHSSANTKLFHQANIRKHDLLAESGSAAFQELVALVSFLGDCAQDLSDEHIQRWGKLRLHNKRVLQTQVSYTKGEPARKSCWFSAVDVHNDLIFGEALAFYEVDFQSAHSASSSYVAFKMLKGVHRILSCIRGRSWSSDICILPVDRIQDIIGIWDAQSYIYVLQKHPGLELLTVVESGVNEGLGGQDNN